MDQPVPTKSILQPAKAAAMCTACHEYAPPPIPHFLLVQNLYLPADNLQPKSDDTKGIGVKVYTFVTHRNSGSTMSMPLMMLWICAVGGDLPCGLWELLIKMH